MKRMSRPPHDSFLRLIQFLLFFVFLAPPLLANAANLPLQIINIKPAGTGSPAIPSTHRIFHAYPGIEYKIRAAVGGGDYPYAYALSNAPSGMTVDAAGYIRWPNPQTNATNIGLRITDSTGNYINTSWSISVHTSGFRFVDVSSQTNGTGTIGSPHNSIANMAVAAAATDIIYFRSGTYSVPARGTQSIGNASAFEFENPSSTAAIWLAYPSANVTINLTNNRYFYGATSVPFYFEGLRFYQGREYFFRASSTSNYVTFLDNTFDTLTLERTNYNSNQGTYFTMHGDTGHYLTFQGNTFSGYRGAQGIGSLYDQDMVLIEDNHFSDFSGANLGATNQVFAFKIGIANLTFRGNVVNLASTSDFGIMGGNNNGAFSDGTPYGYGSTSENIEISYNYFRHDGRGLVEFNRYNDQGTTWFYRNTVVSGLQMTNLNEDCDGPWTVNNNVFQNSSAGLSYHYTCTGNYTACLSQTGNIGATSAVVDSGGKLLSSRTASVGVAGWQFPDGSTPMDHTYTPGAGSSATPAAPSPMGLNITTAQ